MTEHFVTIFDSAYLLQGLALHRSMQRNIPSFRLWVVCVDHDAWRMLGDLQLPGVTALAVADLETAELRAVKGARSRGEYCWTLTPFAPRFVFDADPTVERVTYVDADLWFRRSPAPVFREFEASGKQVLITDHAFAPEYDQSAIAGQYCVQFMTFNRDAGEPVRKWWEERCIEWCYARLEDGKFGDQKYLDHWPEMFPDQVHVLADKSLLLAPWNASTIPYGHSVAFHFHGLKVYRGYKVLKRGANYKVPRVVDEQIYDRYLLDLAEGAKALARHGHTPRLPAVRYADLWLDRLRQLASGVLSVRSALVTLR
ncbi:MAG: glycosyl transferase [Pseudomonadota bacterium]